MGNKLDNNKFPKLGGNLPNLGNSGFPSLGVAQSLFSMVQLKVLRFLFGQPDRIFQMAELISLVGSGVGAVLRVVRRLLKGGLVIESRIGKIKLYQANKASPVFPEVHSFILKTVGLSLPLAEALEQFSDHILVAFIFGSIASGKDKSRSDVDVLIIGDNLLYSQILLSLQQVEKSIGRNISAKIMTPQEWRNKVEHNNSFTTNVLSQPRIFLKGSEIELRSVE